MTRTLKFKLAALVAFVTLVILGSYYFLAKNSANSAIVDFNEQSSVIISDVLLDDDEVFDDVLAKGKNIDVTTAFDYLTKTHSDHIFVVIDETNQIMTNFSTNGYQAAGTVTSSGVRFKIEDVSGSTSIVSINNSGQFLTLKNKTRINVLWFPVALLERRALLDSFKQRIQNEFVITLSVLSLLAVALSWFGARLFLRPLNTLSHGFERLVAGDLDYRISSHSTDELGTITRRFNHLADWLNALNKQYKQLSADLAHELRTPINGMQSRIEAMQDGIVPTDENSLSQLLNALERIKKLIDDINLLSLTDAKQLHVEMQPITVSSFLREREDMLNQLLAHRLTLNLANNITVQADPHRLEQVLTNLVSNAAKYADKNEAVELFSRTKGSFIEIGIKDKGQGIPADQQAAAFERFYRQDASRSDKQSVGLGLAICQQLALLMQGKMRINHQYTEGLEIYIQLPVNA
ncbi:ATP-binding protein [Aestuariibacter sp. AA17]|uniref:histidine kinase n=1 Tax=Fluctibacter corallii TaxID=2984329 RepID=A0ABT3A3H9_9ALTE|nr:ATP-binding protein [Aestuariibacter sp. AA17]MCV2883168.1 ATP-binding protein [Aestuariibacter sp. AA17]